MTRAAALRRSQDSGTASSCAAWAGVRSGSRSAVLSFRSPCVSPILRSAGPRSAIAAVAGGAGAQPASPGFVFWLAGVHLGAGGSDAASGRGVRSRWWGWRCGIGLRGSRFTPHHREGLLRRSAGRANSGEPLLLQNDDVFVGDDVQGQAAFALAADEVALEERAARHEAAVCR